MRIVQIPNSDLQDDILPRTRLPPCGQGPQHVHSISNSALTLLQIQDYVFIILKPIQTKISVCFDPIIYPPGSHQLAGRLDCLAHGFLVCPIRSSYMSCQRWQRSIQLSSIETQSEPLEEHSLTSHYVQFSP